MLSVGKPNVVIAFHTDIKHSKGTADMIRISLKARIKTYLHNGLKLFTLQPKDMNFSQSTLHVDIPDGPQYFSLASTPKTDE